MGNGTIIELNGRRYDAASGVLLGASASKAQSSHAATRHAGRVIGDVVPAKTGKSLSPARPLPHKPASHHAAASQSVPAKMVVKRSVKPATAHRPEKPHTLMRRAVHKPAASLKPTLKVQAPAELAAEPLPAITPKSSVARIDPLRLAHANHTPRSAAIQRFFRPRSPQTSYVAPPARGSNSTGSLIAQVQNVAVRPVPASFRASRQDPSIRPAQPSAKKPARPAPSSTQLMLEAAVASATSHLQPAPSLPSLARRRRWHVLRGTTIGLVALLAVAGAAYWNRSSIEIRVAAHTAGFHATLPAAPTGYALIGSPRATKGQVVLTFGSGDSLLKLAEQPSNLNSQSLLQTDKLLAAASYQTIVAGNALVYRYGTNAAWVDNGILYTISGNAELNDDQIITLVTSL